MYELGENVTVSLQVINSGVEVDDATATVTVVNPEGTTIVSAGVAFYDPTEEQYTHNIPYTLITVIGTYSVTWEITGSVNLTEHQLFNVGYSAISADNLLTLRHEVSALAEGNDGFYTGNVTDANTSSISDDARVEANKTFVGWYVYIYAGTGAGQMRRCTAFTSPTLTVDRPWDVVPTDTSRYELHRYFTVPKINTAIQRATLNVSDICWVPADRTVTIDDDNYEYSIPPGITGIYRVEVPIDFAGTMYYPLSHETWKVRRTARKLVVNYRILSRYPATLRLYCIRPPVVPIADSSPIEVPSAFIIAESARILAQQMTGSGDASIWASRKQEFLGEAQAEKQRIYKQVPNNLRRV